MSEEDKPVIRKRIIASVLISIIAIVLIFRFTASDITWELLKKADWRFLLIALFLHTFYWIFWSIRLKYLTGLLEHKISSKDSIKITLISTFFAAVTPSSAGGEPVRVKMLGDRGVETGSASAIVLAERFLDGVFFIFALPVFLIISGFSLDFGLRIGGTFLLLISAFIILMYYLLKNPKRGKGFIDRFHPLLIKFMSKEKADDWINRFKEQLINFRGAAKQLAKRNPLQILATILFTSLIWLPDFLIPSAILLGLNHDPYYLFSVTSQLILVMLALVPITPGSSGIVEGGMVFLYSQFVRTSILGILIALWRSVTYFSNLILGLLVTVYTYSSKNKTQNKNHK